MLRFRIKERLAERSWEEGRRITLKEMSQATGIGPAVLSSLGSPGRTTVTNTRYLEAICRYLHCTLDELVEFSPERSDSEPCHIDVLYEGQTSD